MAKKQSKEVVQTFLEDKCLVVPKTLYKGFYVYVAVFSGIVYYVGKGSKSRYLHVNSGRSGNSELNRLHFLDVLFDVYILKDGLCEKESFTLEEDTINMLKPLFNVAVKSNIGKSGIKLNGLIWSHCSVCKNLLTSRNVPNFHEDKVICSGMCVNCDDDYGCR